MIIVYTIQQLQAAEYLLKSAILEKEESADKKLDFKFVIEFQDQLWTGNFIDFNKRFISQIHFGNRFPKNETYDYNSIKLIQKIVDTEVKVNEHLRFYLEDRYLTAALKLIFDLVNEADIQPEDSPIYPYLLNARSLDGKLNFPFLNLENQKIHVVSLINTKDSTE